MVFRILSTSEMNVRSLSIVPVPVPLEGSMGRSQLHCVGMGCRVRLTSGQARRAFQRIGWAFVRGMVRAWESHAWLGTLENVGLAPCRITTSLDIRYATMQVQYNEKK